MGILTTLVGTSPTVSTVDWSTLINASSFNGLIDGVTSALPAVIPTAITLMSIPFVWGMIRKMVKKH